MTSNLYLLFLLIEPNRCHFLSRIQVNGLIYRSKQNKIRLFSLSHKKSYKFTSVKNLEKMQLKRKKNAKNFLQGCRKIRLQIVLMEINTKKINNRKIKRFAISKFNDNIDESINLNYFTCKKEFTHGFIDYDDSDTCKATSVFFDRSKFTKAQSLYLISPNEQSIPEQQSESQTEIFVNQEKINQNNLDPYQNLYPLAKPNNQQNQAFLFKDNLQKYIEQLRNIKLQRDKKNTMKNIYPAKTLSRYKIRRGHDTRKILGQMNQSLDNKRDQVIRGRKSFKKLQEVPRNYVSPHFVEMQISVDPDCAINGIRRLPSMHIDKSLFGNKFFQQFNKKSISILNAKNTFEPVFRAHMKEKSEQFSNSKEEFSKKFENFLGKVEDTPLKITYNQHLKMKEEAYKKKEQELLSKFNKNFSSLVDDDGKDQGNKRRHQSSELEDKSMKNAQKIKKDVNILDQKNYQELIKTENISQMKNKNILKKKFMKNNENTSLSMLSRHAKKVSFCSNWPKNTYQLNQSAGKWKTARDSWR